MKTTYILIMFVYFMISSLEAQGSAWLTRKNHYMVLTELSWLNLTNPRNHFKLSQMHFTNLVEYGYDDKLTLGMKHSFTYYQQRYTKDNSRFMLCDEVEINRFRCPPDIIEQPSWQQGSGFGVQDKKKTSRGNLDLYLRKQLWENSNSLLSLQPSLTLTQCEPEIRLLYGINFTYKNQPNFINAELGWRKNTWRPDELIAEFTHGVKISQHVTILNQLLARYQVNKLNHTDQLMAISTATYNREWGYYDVKVTRYNARNPNYKRLSLQPKLSLISHFKDGYSFHISLALPLSAQYQIMPMISIALQIDI